MLLTFLAIVSALETCVVDDLKCAWTSGFAILLELLGSATCKPNKEGSVIKSSNTSLIYTDNQDSPVSYTRTLAYQKPFSQSIQSQILTGFSNQALKL